MAFSRSPSPLLQGEIGHHPFSPLGTRNPCVSFPVKGLPSPVVTQKSTVWLQFVTASAGRASVCAHACMCVGVLTCTCRMHLCDRVCPTFMCVREWCKHSHAWRCVWTCACPVLQHRRPRPGLKETRVLTPAMPLTRWVTLSLLLDLSGLLRFSHLPNREKLSLPRHLWELVQGSKDDNKEKHIWKSLKPHTNTCADIFTPLPSTLPPTLTTQPPPDMLQDLFGDVTQCETILGQKIHLHIFRTFLMLEQKLWRTSSLETLLPECAISFFVFCTQICVLSFCVLGFDLRVLWKSFVVVVWGFVLFCWSWRFIGLVWFLPYLRTELTTFRRKLGNHFCFFFNFEAPEPPMPRFESQWHFSPSLKQLHKKSNLFSGCVWTFFMFIWNEKCERPLKCLKMIALLKENVLVVTNGEREGVK